MKKILLLALALVSASWLSGTAQSSDWMIYDGQFFHIAENPLRTFPWPDDKQPWFEIAPGVMSTGNYRGYLAIWEIRDGKLYLAGIDSFVRKPISEIEMPEPSKSGTMTWTQNDESDRVDLKKLFASRYKDGRVFADWFTGVIRIPDGKLLEYVHFGYASVYERDILLHFEAGVLKKSEVKTNKLPDDSEAEAPQEKQGPSS